MKNILNKLIFLITILVGLQLLAEEFVVENKSISIELKIETDIEKGEKEEKEDKDESFDLFQQSPLPIKQIPEYQNYFDPHYQNPPITILTSPPELTA